ncbi:hypothetical protein F5051DRAFT_431901 [Lentinula edodes]|nr:hypothetical protein F5051DRAFT_431901 [Lentinula edodes]
MARARTHLLILSIFSIYSRSLLSLLSFDTAAAVTAEVGAEVVVVVEAEVGAEAVADVEFEVEVKAETELEVKVVFIVLSLVPATQVEAAEGEVEVEVGADVEAEADVHHQHHHLLLHPLLLVPLPWTLITETHYQHKARWTFDGETTAALSNQTIQPPRMMDGWPDERRLGGIFALAATGVDEFYSESKRKGKRDEGLSLGCLRRILSTACGSGCLVPSTFLILQNLRLQPHKNGKGKKPRRE